MAKSCGMFMAKTAFFVLFVQLVLIQYYQQNVTNDVIKTLISNEISENFKHSINDTKKNSTTVILMWTKYYDGIENESLLKNIRYGTNWYKGCCSEPVCCTDSDILITRNRDFLPKATAIVFSHYSGNLNFNDLPPTRTPDQLWVLFTVESPIFSNGLENFGKLFNLTMGYRRDSDIYSPYGYKVPLEKPLSPESQIIMPGGVPLDKWIAGKTKTLVAAISHCTTETHSKREELVNFLVNSSLAMDVYGKCSKLQMCSRLDLSCNQTQVWMNVSASYKFYFAAENALCEDYITEKFWRTLQIGMVPLVYGGANYTAVAPPNSFIDLQRFKSLSELESHLTWLSENPSEYSKYFEWRRQYDVKKTDCWHGWCELCKKAKEHHNNSKGVAVKIHEDLRDWWLNPVRGNKRFNACYSPQHFISKFTKKQ